MDNFYDELEIILRRLDEQVALIVAKLKIGKKIDPEDIFFDNQEFLQLMNISKRTAQEWRNKKVIPFSQVGNKIYYTLSDIQKLLKEHYVSK